MIRESGNPRFHRKTADARRDSLIEAAHRCIARDGIAGFTVDNVSQEAGVSRGLINHHFDGIEGLLVAVYTSMTSSMEAAGRTARSIDGGAEEQLAAVINTMFAPHMFSKASLRAWLALWGEVAVNPKLRNAHRKSYSQFRLAMTAAIAALATARHLKLDEVALATTIIALIDGLWIEWCLDPTIVTPQQAKDRVYDVLEARLGRLQR